MGLHSLQLCCSALLLGTTLAGNNLTAHRNQLSLTSSRRAHQGASALANRLNVDWLEGYVLVRVLANAGAPHSTEEFAAYISVTGAQMWADVGQPRTAYRSGVSPDICSATAINHLHNGVFMPGRFMSRAAPNSTAYQVSQLLLPCRHMPMLVLNSTNLQEDRRVSCCYAHDEGTNLRPCATPGGNSSCIPGCGQNNVTSIETCVAKSHEYNEVVLDTWKEGGWDNPPGLGLRRYVEALALDVQASNLTLGLVLAVQQAALQAGLPLDILAFDPSKRAPFAPHPLF
jgi:hypothetical protein